MKKKTMLFTVISCLVTLIPMLAGLLLWSELPERMPTSFDFDGNVTGYSSKIFAVVLLPLILVGANLLCVFFMSADPKRKNQNKYAIPLVLSIVAACSIFCGILQYKQYLGITIGIGTFASVFLGVVFIAIGFILPKCKQNYTIGIRLPWTLSSETNWEKTHTFGGRLWVWGGIIMAIFGILGFEIASIFVMLVLAILPMIYSYVYYRKHELNKF